MPAASVRLDPSRPEVAEFVSDDLALSVWEMLRRFGRASPVSDLASACALPIARVQGVLDRAMAIGLVRRVPAGKGDSRVRFQATGDRILMEVDPASAAVRTLLGECFRRFAEDSRRCIDESMADAARGRHGVPAMASMTHLVLEPDEARELIGLFRPIDEFVARMSERHDREPSPSPRRCNYHLALHVAPVSTERLPPARMTFAEKGAAMAQVEAGFERRASRVLSPRERAVAGLLVKGQTRPEIASSLGVSTSTVSTLCERIYRKLGITRRAQLAMKLHALGDG